MKLYRMRALRNPRVSGIPVALLTGLAVVCSGASAQQDPPPPAQESTPPADASTPTAGDAAAQPGSSSEMIAPTAPKSYTVQTGDTLWDIANVFLRDPWYWPEIWYVNPQVQNPHLIYPGDVLALAYGADGSAQVRLERGGANRLSPKMRSQPLEGAITAIPYEIIAAFMSRPQVLEKDQYEAAPYILSSRDQHLVMATGNTIYASGNVEGDVATRYSIVRVGEPLVDPEDNDVVGYEGVYAATARVTRTGKPTTLEITESTREAMEGDRLFPGDVDVPLDFIPHAPAQPIEGQIISIVDGISGVGQYQVVVINRGRNHGLEPGHILLVEETGAVVRDRQSGGGRVSPLFAKKVRLPNELAGTFMVFKTFDRVSYGLIMEAQVPMRVHDRVVSP
jgi:LysM repeat protein